MSINKSLQAVALAFGILGSGFAGFSYLEDRHATKLQIEAVRAENIADRKASKIDDLRIRQEIIRKDIKSDNVTRDYYEEKFDTEEALKPAEVRRLNNLNEQLIFKYEDQRKIEQRLYDYTNESE